MRSPVKVLEANPRRFHELGCQRREPWRKVVLVARFVFVAVIGLLAKLTQT
jgi:hypothetical protein